MTDWLNNSDMTPNTTFTNSQFNTIALDRLTDLLPVSSSTYNYTSLAGSLGTTNIKWDEINVRNTNSETSFFNNPNTMSNTSNALNVKSSIKFYYDANNSSHIIKCEESGSLQGNLEITCDPNNGTVCFDLNPYGRVGLGGHVQSSSNSSNTDWALTVTNNLPNTDEEGLLGASGGDNICRFIDLTQSSIFTVHSDKSSFHKVAEFLDDAEIHNNKKLIFDYTNSLWDGLPGNNPQILFGDSTNEAILYSSKINGPSFNWTSKYVNSRNLGPLSSNTIIATDSDAVFSAFSLATAKLYGVDYNFNNGINVKIEVNDSLFLNNSAWLIKTPYDFESDTWGDYQSVISTYVKSYNQESGFKILGKTYEYAGKNNENPSVDQSHNLWVTGLVRTDRHLVVAPNSPTNIPDYRDIPTNGWAIYADGNNSNALTAMDHTGSTTVLATG